MIPNSAIPKPRKTETSLDNNNEFEGWAILEIMGHQKFAGYVSTQAVAGSSMLRIDVPAVEGHQAFSKLFGTSSIYAMTPVDEEVAKAMAKSLRKAPVDLYEFPSEVVEAMRAAQQKQLPAPEGESVTVADESLRASDQGNGG